MPCKLAQSYSHGSWTALRQLDFQMVLERPLGPFSSIHCGLRLEFGRLRECHRPLAKCKNATDLVKKTFAGRVLFSLEAARYRKGVRCQVSGVRVLLVPGTWHLTPPLLCASLPLR